MPISYSSRRTSDIDWSLRKQKAKTQNYQKLSGQTSIIMLRLQLEYDL